MKFVITGIAATLSLRLRSVRCWAVLLLLPLLVCSVNLLLPEQEAAAPVQVGVCLPKRGGEAFWELLESRGGTVMTFLPATEEEIDRNVASGNWDCGLILPKDFEDRVEDLEKDGLITLRISSASVAYPLVRECAGACLAQLMSPRIAAEYLLESEIIPDGETLEAALRLETLGEGERVNVKLSTPDGSPLEPVELGKKTTDTILRWILSASLLVWMLLSAADLGRWSRTGAASRLRPLRPVTALLLSRIGADGLLALSAGCLAQLLLGGGILGCLATAGYVLLWMSVAVLLARWEAVWQALPVCMPFLVVVSLLLSSALVDLSWFLAPLAAVGKLLPVSLYLRGCEGDFLAVAALLVAAPACLGLSIALDAAMEKQRNKL